MKKTNVFNALALSLLLYSGATQSSDASQDVEQASPETQPSWSIAFENDILAGGDSDKDYTYGLNFTLADSDPQRFRFSPQPLLQRLDGLLGVEDNNHQQHHQHYSLELGVYGFTPDDIAEAAPIYDDRPYASLVYAQSRNERINLAGAYSWTSSLSIGVLGLDLVGSAQNRFHRAIDGNEAQGWTHQISDGGELTAKYSLARQQIVYRNPTREVKITHQGSIGYITEAGAGLSLRSGRFADSWWSFDPDLVSYGERSSQGKNKAAPEAFWWAGVNVKARLYNVFLQGQFRESDVTYSGSELRHGLLEAWAGYTLGFRNGYRISYYVRGHTSEIKSGQGDRHILWGGIAVSRSLGAR